MMALRLASLVLACTTAWSLLALGYLPVDRLRQHGAEPIKAIVAWMIVAATAPPAIFHWYLIIALLCFIAWTKLDRLAGKFWLAGAGALGLSLGIVFPIEISPLLAAHETASTLGLLYLGGAMGGFAYALHVRAKAREIFDARRLTLWILILSAAWGALLEEGWRHGGQGRPLLLPIPQPVMIDAPLWLPLAVTGVLVMLALRAFLIARSNRVPSPWLSLAMAFAAMAASWLAQVVTV